MYLKFNSFISMIPYPSGKIHLGHSRNYIINDIINRFFFLKNSNRSVMFMGWDSFGSPAENASIIKNMLPSDYLRSNINYMKNQLLYCDFSINWNNSLTTYKFNYYYFNQLLFLFFLLKNVLYLNYKKSNWDVCEKTILSNEQVINGKGWRSFCLVKKLNIKTYYFNMKKYIIEIFNEIDNLLLPLKVKIMQKNWIFNISFFNFFKIFSNFIIFKKTFIIYSLYIFLFFIIYKLLIKKEFIFLDLLFCKKIFNLGIYLKNLFNQKSNFWVFKEKKYYWNFNFKFNNFFSLKDNNIFFFKHCEFLNDFELFEKFKFKKIIFIKINWKVKDWGISRQKYWGSNIPSFFCIFCKNHYIFNKNKIPYLVSKNLKKNNLYFFKFSNKILCEYCSKFSFKEIFTMDTFVDSSWYFLKFFNKKYDMNLNMPIDLYIGGIEHSILHLLYSRYFIKILRDLKFLNFGEPFKRVFSQGMILCKNSNGITKMSKSGNYTINPEKLILKYSVDSLRFTLLKNSLNKDFLWKNNIIISNHLFLENLICFLINYTNKYKIIFFKNIKINKNIKIFNYFINKNFKKINHFLKNLFFNNCLIFFIKILKIFKKIVLLNNFNIFLFKIFYFNILVKFYFLFPYFINFNFNFLKFYKFIKINNLYYNKIMKCFLKNKKILKLNLILNKKNLGFLLSSFFLKKKIYNFLFFKKKILKNFFIKITLIKFILNIFIN